MTSTARQLRQPPTIEAIERVPYFADVVDRISVDGISASYREGGRRRRKRLVLVVTTRLVSIEVEL